MIEFQLPTSTPPPGDSVGFDSPKKSSAKKSKSLEALGKMYKGVDNPTHTQPCCPELG